MQHLTKDTIHEFEVEDYVYLMVEEKMSADILRGKIHNFSLEESNQKRALQRLQFAKERIDKSLTVEELVVYFFFPFGNSKKFSSNASFDVKEQKRLGFVNRVKQYNLISMIGVVMYLVVFMFISLWMT